MKVRRPRRIRPARRTARESFRRGIFLLPSLFTVGNMLCGFASVLHAIHQRLELAAWLIILAGVLDGLDGRIARLTNSSSDFGKEYDSLADVVSFGVAPAILAYQWGLNGMGRWGWAVAFLFLVAGSVRLARFNVHAHDGDRRFFTGLPIPAGAGSVTMMVLVAPDPVVGQLKVALVWAFVFVVSVLMVSTVPYRSFKDFDMRQRWPATAFFVFALILAVVVVSPLPVMAFLAAAYLVSGPLEMAVGLVRRTRDIRPREDLEASGAAAPPVHTDHP
jgi:CDP-diacylglycerol---serine O-phosphatidyltransferase